MPERTPEELAHFLFVKNAEDYDIPADQLDEHWQNLPSVKEFWVGQANLVFGFLGLDVPLIPVDAAE